MIPAGLGHYGNPVAGFPLRVWRMTFKPHRHQHTAVEVFYPNNLAAVFGSGIPRTFVLYRCPCNRPGHVLSETLIGHWTIEQVRGDNPETVLTSEVTAGDDGT